MRTFSPYILIRFIRHTLSLIAVCLLMTKIVIAADAQVKVLSFNVWTADNTVAGTNKLVEIIQASGADMVGVQELSETRLSSMATSLGWHSYRLSDVDEQILSRYPVLQATPV